MSKMAKALFNPGDGGAGAIAVAQAKQQKAINAEAAKADKVAAGQAKAAGASSGGLLAFIENQLGKVFG